METKKYIIEITSIDSLPENWTEPKSWPGTGIYAVNGESFLYSVSTYTVSSIFSPCNLTKIPFSDDQITGITETLLLKAIAAASRAEVLK